MTAPCSRAARSAPRGSSTAPSPGSTRSRTCCPQPRRIEPSMRYSQAFIPTLKEDPADAELVSHRLMVRAGMLRKHTAGIYSLLPVGWRAVQKVMRIVREELNREGAQELSLPILMPSELWEESGRWQKHGRELFRQRDRHDRDYAL